MPDGWSLTSKGCVNNANGNAIGSGITDGVSVNVAAGADITCTFTDVKHAKLTLVKQATPEGSTSFDFDATGGGVDADIDLVDDGTNANTASYTLNANQLGAHTFTENVPDGWSLTSKGCVNNANGNAIGSGITDGVSVNVAAGADITCTFVNKRLPTLTVKKHVVNDNGGEALASAWKIYVKSDVTGLNEPGSPKAGSETGDKYTLSPGTYTVSENTGPAGYSFDGYTYACDLSGSVTLAYGDNKVCNSRTTTNRARS